MDKLCLDQHHLLSLVASSILEASSDLKMIKLM